MHRVDALWCASLVKRGFATMPQAVRSVRGTRDVYGQEQSIRSGLVQAAQRTCASYGYSEIATPLIEPTDLFTNSLGDSTDVVSKEMYTLDDRSGNSLCLRPEGTAGVVRAAIENGILSQLPQKLFYFGPMFRYERPQRGRYRQFHQIGIEMLGGESPMYDVEVIDAGRAVLDATKVPREAYSLHINTLGDQQTRVDYERALGEYLCDHKSALSETSQMRLNRGSIMRILDSKEREDGPIIAGAPKIDDFYSEAARERFGRVLEGLDALGIQWHLNPRLVRGLDYYCHTIFEFVEVGSQGTMNTVLAGGRYDGLAAMLGYNQPLPCIGFAAGVERIEQLSKFEAPKGLLHVVVVEERKSKHVERGADVLKLIRQLRQAGCRVDCRFDGNANKQFKFANNIQADFTVIMESGGALVAKEYKRNRRCNLDPNNLVADFLAFASG